MTTLPLQASSEAGCFVATKKVGYDTSRPRAAADLAVRMNSEPAKATESVGFRFPALVTLTPKRRFKMTDSVKLQKIEFKDADSPALETHRPARMKRSGRMALRWSTRVSPFVSHATAINCAPYAP